MLEAIQIRNFQIWKKKTIHFDPKTTVIAGPTDSGKSAILRALYWVFYNQPSGDEFITKGTDAEVIVRIKIDGHTITRRRGGKLGNVYQLDGTTYKAFGRSEVPAPVADILNVTRDNFQRQHDAAFWFSLSAGQVSKELNAVVDLSVVDRVLSQVGKDLREAKAEDRLTTERVDNAVKRRDDLNYLSDMNSQLKKLEEQNNQLEANTEVLVDLNNTTTELTQLKKNHRANKERLAQAETKGKELEETWKKLRIVRQKVIALETCLESIQKLKQTREKLNIFLSAKETKFHKLNKGKCPICQKTFDSE